MSLSYIGEGSESCESAFVQPFEPTMTFDLFCERETFLSLRDFGMDYFSHPNESKSSCEVDQTILYDEGCRIDSCNSDDWYQLEESFNI